MGLDEGKNGRLIRLIVHIICFLFFSNVRQAANHDLVGIGIITNLIRFIIPDREIHKIFGVWIANLMCDFRPCRALDTVSCSQLEKLVAVSQHTTT